MATKIRFQCACGKELSAPPELAGKKAKCSRCGAVVRVPASGNENAQVANAVKRTSAATTDEPSAGTVSSPIATSARPGRSASRELADQLFSAKPSGNMPSIWEVEKGLIAPAAAPKYCPQCGKTTAAGDAFCAECGASLASIAAGTMLAKSSISKPVSGFSLGELLANRPWWANILIPLLLVGFDFMLLKTFRAAGLLFLIPFLAGGLILLLIGLIWAWFVLLKENPKVALVLLFRMLLAAFRLRLRVRGGSRGSGEASYEQPKRLMRYGGFSTMVGIAMLLVAVSTGSLKRNPGNFVPQPVQPMRPVPQFVPQKK